MTADAVYDRFQTWMAPYTLDQFGPRICVAVSGGGDSMALLDLTHRWAGSEGWTVHAVSVDHGLRDVTAEISLVAAFCSKNDIKHAVLVSSGWDGVGNLQDSARRARHGLIADWASDRGIDQIFLGHTADDQAETVLMRLARGSGVDGLAGMQDVTGTICRPLLAERRADLRTYLTERGIPWAEDPSNDDLRFDRIKARRMMGHLVDLGLTTERLLQTAAHMQAARASLRAGAVAFAAEHVTEDRGDLVFTKAALSKDGSETPDRVFSAAIQWIGGQTYRPRFAALQDAARALRQGEARTLGGVLMTPEAGKIRLTREAAATQPAEVTDPRTTAASWDGRWILSPGPAAGRTRGTSDRFDAGMQIGALGADLVQIKDWRNRGLPRASLLASPAIRQGDRLIAAPLAQDNSGWTARIAPHFSTYLLMH